MNWRKIIRDLLLALSSQAFYKLAGFLVLLILTRYLPKEQMGIVFFAATLSTMAALFTELGTSSHLVRGVAAEPDMALAHFASVLSIRIPLLALYLVLLNGVVWLWRPDIITVLALTSFYVLLEELYRIAGALFLGLQKVLYNVICGVSTRLLLVGFIFLVVRMNGDVHAVLGCYIVANILLVLFAYGLVISRLGRIPDLSDCLPRREILRESFHLFLLALLSMLHFKVDSAMLGFIGPYTEVATYEAAFRLLEASRFVILPVSMIFYPQFAEIVARRDWPLLRSLTRRLLGYASGIGIAVAAGVMLFAANIIPIVFGDRYDDSIGVLRILYICVPMLYVANLLGILARVARREKEAVWVLFGCLSLNVALNAYVIPRWGAVGAAATTVATETLRTLFLLYLGYLILRNPGKRVGASLREVEISRAG